MPEADRSALLASLSRFVAASHRGAALALLAPDSRLTQNGGTVARDAFRLPGTATPYRLLFADEDSGEAGCHATFSENGVLGLYSIRARIAAGAVSEAECLVARKGDSNAFAPHRLATPDPAFARIEANGQRLSRADLIAIADGYFDAIEASSGEGAAIAVDCDRVENGLRTTNNPAAGLPLDCRDGMTMFGYIDRVRDRRYPLVDVARGVVLGVAALEVPAGRTLPLVIDGRTVERPQAERSIFLSELFKIANGQIAAIDVVVRNMAKGAPLGWPH